MSRDFRRSKRGIDFISNRYDAALIGFEKSANDAMSSAERLAIRGEELSLSGDRAGAIELYKEALCLYPDYTMCHNILGIAYAAIGENDLAMSCYDRAIELDGKDPEFYYNKGLIYNKTGRSLASLSCFQRAIDLSPKVAGVEGSRGASNAHDAKGTAYAVLGRYVEAQKCFDRAIVLNPSNARAYAHKGRASREQGDDASAVLYYGKSLELDESNVESHCNIGVSCVSLGRYDEAMSHYKRALELDPRDGTVYHNMGYLYQQIGNRERTLVCLIIGARLGHAPSREALRMMDIPWTTDAEDAESEGALEDVFMESFMSSHIESPPVDSSLSASSDPCLPSPPSEGK